MKLIPADPALPLYGPTGDVIDPVAGIEVDPTDVFWARRVLAGEAVEAPPVTVKPAKGN